MRTFNTVLVLTLAAAAVFIAIVVMTQPQAHDQKNAYWPYSVETVVRDR